MAKFSEHVDSTAVSAECHYMWDFQWCILSVRDKCCGIFILFGVLIVVDMKLKYCFTLLLHVLCT